MKIKFLGTKGKIEIKNRFHKFESSALIYSGKKKIMIDCGEDWLEKLPEIGPDAIIITHAHPDHAFGLRCGAPCPVYATKETWEILKNFPVEKKISIEKKRPFEIFETKFEAFDVLHSIRAPAVGYRITQQSSIFYVPDVVYIPDMEKALKNVSLYIGDGAALKHSLVRRRGDTLFGHTTVSAQIGWCAKNGVKKAIFTHCGTEIVSMDHNDAEEIVKDMGKKRGVEAKIAYDSMLVTIN
ncbi:MBL fold metallo-hydrolase [Nitrosophilus alvini]|uniref:MBL fold metallo-hydrolase n=1 Tax=Nitrosophilus alvini TaxID=2714855 RepID=UPI00190AA932|nr:MBL fold metallo-hydrolase [Nitrosophilus alvini]